MPCQERHTAIIVGQLSEAKPSKLQRPSPSGSRSEAGTVCDKSLGYPSHTVSHRAGTWASGAWLTAAGGGYSWIKDWRVEDPENRGPSPSQTGTGMPYPTSQHG